jgi:hypothetical protein
MLLRKWGISLTALTLVTGLSAGSAFADSNHGHQNNGKHLGWVNQQVKFGGFDDIGADYSWAQNAIQKLAEEGIIHGVDAHHFQPGGKLNRAQFAALLTQYFSLQPANPNQQDFKDVHIGDWDFTAIEASKDYMTMFTDIGGGYDFKPLLPINRSEAAVTLVQLLIKENAVQLVSADQANQILSTYKDANLIPQNLRIHVATAIQAGVLKGVGHNRFDPLSTLNRAQAATLLYNLQTQLQVPPTNSDDNGTSTEVTPGTPSTNPGTTSLSVSYQSSSYNVPVGTSVYVSSNELGSVYLIPSSYAPTTVSALNAYINQGVGTESSVTQVNTSVGLNTSNLSTGDYSVYATDAYGNLVKLNNTVQIVAAQQTSLSVSYQSPSYNVTVGTPVYVSSNELGSVYLIPSSYAAPTSVSALDSYINQNIGTKTSVTQVNTSVALNTTNLATGDYSVYATDADGNLVKLGNTVHIVAAQPTVSSVQLQSKTTDNTGNIQLTLDIQTANTINSTQAQVELVNNDGTSLNPSITTQATINNNAGTATLEIPATLQAGNYKVKVTVGSYSDTSLPFVK